MDSTQKEHNRSKWRASAKRGRGRGGGRGGGGRGGGHRTLHGPDLQSNYDRYFGSDDEEAQDAGQLGLHARQSQGADLQQLLAESEQFYAQAHFRYRSFLEAVDTQPPPVDVAAFEEELVIQPGPLLQALALMPLHQLLGLAVPPELLAEGSWDTPPRIELSKQLSAQQQQQQTAAPAAPPHAQPELRQYTPPWQQHLVQRAGRQQPSVSQVQAAAAAAHSAPAPAVPAAPLQAPAAMATALAAKADDDDTDELLELLLSGAPPPPQVAAGAAARQAASAAESRAAAHSAPGAASAETTAGGSGRVPAQAGALSAVQASQQQPWQPPAAAVQAGRPGVSASAAKPPSAAFDDELDALLGLGTAAASGQSQQPRTEAAPQAPTAGSSKKQSLEEWLDGF